MAIDKRKAAEIAKRVGKALQDHLTLTDLLVRAQVTVSVKVVQAGDVVLIVRVADPGGLDLPVKKITSGEIHRGWAPAGYPVMVKGAKGSKAGKIVRRFHAGGHYEIEYADKPGELVMVPCTACSNLSD